MEALESLGIDWKLLIAQVINFLVVLLVLKKFLYGPIVNMLIDRKNKIEQGLKDSQEAREKLNETNAQTRKLLAEASLESEKIIKSTKKEMEEQTKKKLDEAQKKAEEIIATSKRLAQEEQERIVQKAKKEISELAINISEKILEKQVDKDSVNKAINQL